MRRRSLPQSATGIQSGACLFLTAEHGENYSAKKRIRVNCPTTVLRRGLPPDANRGSHLATPESEQSTRVSLFAQIDFVTDNAIANSMQRRMSVIRLLKGGYC